ncbi:MAG: acyl-CoA reductase-like NAD-dependent aldehyde dehydrogenase [Planctomycetota bacterium]|jgi:acyl-CoA reductase-like NAD-dependent aldehyde dehydrogenase
MRDSNWIKGAWNNASKGDVFETNLRAPGVKGPEWWPRSGLPDLEEAISGLRAAAPQWRKLGQAERAKVLTSVLDRWQEETDGVEELALVLGLSIEALDDELERALDTGDKLIADGQDLDASPLNAEGDESLALIQVPAPEFYDGLVSASFPDLLAGRALLIISDPNLPWLALELVERLGSEPELAGVVALLHDDRSVCFPQAAASQAFESSLPRQAFGAGLDNPSRLAIEKQVSLNATFVVFEHDDPVQAAGEAYEGAFGAQRAFSGQRAGQIGRVICHERLLSEFTAALLACIAETGEESVCRVFSSDLARYCSDLCQLGLDEGATLICGGAEDRQGFRGSGQECTMAPSVFTNAEPTMGLVRASRPAPMLSLMRAASDTEACAVRDRFPR